MTLARHHILHVVTADAVVWRLISIDVWSAWLEKLTISQEKVSLYCNTGSVCLAKLSLERAE